MAKINQKSKNDRIKQAKEYIKKNVWKRLLKYKIMELGIIPLSILIIWKLPLLVGWGIIKLFNIDIIHNTWFCNNISLESSKTTICDGINYDSVNIWSLGFFVLFAITIFVLINWYIAYKNIKDEAEDKFDVSWYDL